MPSSGVVVHINEDAPGKQQAVLRNVKNLMDELPELHTELVIQGNAISLALSEGNPYLQELKDLQERGLIVSVCHNTMRAKHIEESDLLSHALVVPSAMGRLVAQQQAGFAYIKP